MRCCERPSTTVTVLDGSPRAGAARTSKRTTAIHGCASSWATWWMRGWSTDWSPTPTAVIHAAAESHVDRSIDDPAAFLRTNVIGTQIRAGGARARTTSHADGLDRRGLRARRSRRRARSTRITPLRPRSPYAASKAAADLLCQRVRRDLRRAGDGRARHERVRPAADRARRADVRDLRAGGRPVPVYGEGRSGASSCYVTDWVRAALTRCWSAASRRHLQHRRRVTSWKTSSSRGGSAGWPARPSPDRVRPRSARSRLPLRVARRTDCARIRMGAARSSFDDGLARTVGVVPGPP